MHRDVDARTLLVRRDHLREDRRVIIDEVVTEDDSEGLVAHEVAGAQDRIAIAERARLTHVAEARDGRDALNVAEEVVLAILDECLLEFVRRVEVILDGALPAARDEDDVFNAARGSLLREELEHGRVDDGQHLLRQRFRHGKEARAESRDREHRLGDPPSLHVGTIRTVFVFIWSLFGMTTLRTPSRYCAEIFCRSTCVGRTMERENAPQ